ncbi:hypothetical protein Scep_022057 [Stephania cephalantha]|uniref:Uncharacterized protein n=1 Tax=Stephania cephalantha TaxID=152367 RepID=A0AAP0F9P8_9MAGN
MILRRRIPYSIESVPLKSTIRVSDFNYGLFLQQSWRFESESHLSLAIDRHCCPPRLQIEVDIPTEVLSQNLIERLPLNIGKLQSLKVLMLDGNRITSLPDELGLLVRLEKLSVSGNLLTCLPETIGSLRNFELLMQNGLLLLPGLRDHA